MADNGAAKIALVTGATGFVGLHLVRRLVEEGWQVHAVVRPSSDLDGLHDVIKKLHIYQHDGTTGGMLEIVRLVQPDVVFHLASLFLSAHQSGDIEGMLQSNLLFGTQLVEAMVKSECHCLVNAGTSWQHFQNEAYSPVNLYAATKQAFESLLAYYLEATPLTAITLKLYDTYGPNDSRQKLFSLLRQVAREQTPLAMSKGEQFLDIVYIDDVTEAFRLAATRLMNDACATQHERFAVSSGQQIRLTELVKTYSETTGVHIPVHWGERPYRAREVMRPWSTGDTLPGWTPKVSLVEGISRMEGTEDPCPTEET